jgi:hypothetical protein
MKARMMALSQTSTLMRALLHDDGADQCAKAQDERHVADVGAHDVAEGEFAAAFVGGDEVEGELGCAGAPGDEREADDQGRDLEAFGGVDGSGDEKASAD